LRLLWSDDALADLERVARRAPVQATRVVGAVERLAALPFPAMHRRIRYGRPDEHLLTIAPHVVLYNVRDDTLTVIAVVDGRRHVEPW
jgi:plasmid stabilization system protein ParE